MTGGVRVTILMVTYNAPWYCYMALRSLRRTKGVEFTVTTVDNCSRLPTQLVLASSAFAGRINRLGLLDRNTLFAEGCNTAARLAPPDATHFLLLNPDTMILDPSWLERLVSVHEPGITSLGCVRHPITRADGYCLLIDRAVWDQAGGLDEQFQWWWSVTRLQASVLRAGHSVQTVIDHESLLRHVGGKSGDAWKGARGMDTPEQEVVSWFDGLPAVRVLPNLDQIEARTK